MPSVVLKSSSKEMLTNVFRWKSMGQIYSLGQRGRGRDKAPIADNNPQQGKSDEELLVQVADGRDFPDL